MDDRTRLPAIAAAIVATTLAACSGRTDTAPKGATDGVVAGSYFRHAKVCVDANGNGRCDSGEAAAYTDANGAFSLPGKGDIVAEIGTDAVRYDPDSGVATPVAQALVFRAPAEANRVVSAISTELRALMDDNGGDFARARAALAERLGIAEDKLLADFNQEREAAIKARLKDAAERLQARISDAVDEAGDAGDRLRALRGRLALERIDNVVVIYAENRGFDHLYGRFPGANGLDNAVALGSYKQVDLDGSVLPVLPPVWGTLTGPGVEPVIAQAQTAGLPNAPFGIDTRFGLPLAVRTRDVDHSFFYNQMQIDGGRNDRFAAVSDAGALVMGNYDGSAMRMWQTAREFTLADNFFMGAFGGSFLNHFWLVCACTPVFPNADTSASKGRLAAPGGADGVTLLLDPTKGVTSVLNSNGRPPFLGNGAITPINSRFDKFYAVNTMQPPYQPSGNAPAAGADPALADPNVAGTLPPQDAPTIGHLLSTRNISWAWYAGAWNEALADRGKIYNGATPNFQAHHQPFNYFRQFAPGTRERALHLKDGNDFVAAVEAGTLPQVAFYKPQGNLNQHAGYADIAAGDAHIAGLIDKLRASPQWRNMLVVVTYDENGGFWDHVAPPRGDRFGPGTRVPTIIISPFTRKGYVDHTQYDTTSVLRLITHRFRLPVLDGLAARDRALRANGEKPMGDLTGSLQLTRQ